MIKLGSQIVVVRHRFGGKLGLPAGTAEAKESARETAYRETWEETGFQVEVGRLLHAAANFFLFECRVLSPAEDKLFPARPVDWLEISEVLLVHPQRLDAAQWRYPGYLPELIRLWQSLPP